MYDDWTRATAAMAMNAGLAVGMLVFLRESILR